MYFFQGGGGISAPTQNWYRLESQYDTNVICKKNYFIWHLNVWKLILVIAIIIINMCFYNIKMKKKRLNKQILVHLGSMDIYASYTGFRRISSGYYSGTPGTARQNPLVPRPWIWASFRVISGRHHEKPCSSIANEYKGKLLNRFILPLLRQCRNKLSSPDRNCGGGCRMVGSENWWMVCMVPTITFRDTLGYIFHIKQKSPPPICPIFKNNMSPHLTQR